MERTINAGTAMVRVLESWGVKHIYGIPGGSINSTMDALYGRRDAMRFIQVRHEEVGAIAAAVDSKLTGRIGVCFGSAGPGATHLFNGLYDAKMDKTPLLALIGQVASTAMNYESFQELNENPMFTDVSVYNRTAMTPESLPHLIDEGIRRAYAYRGVAVVTIPVDFAMRDIPADLAVSAAGSFRKAAPSPRQDDVERAVRLLADAKRPVMYVGQGARGARDDVVNLAHHLDLPIVLSVLAKGIIPDAEENHLGTAARVASKPGNEALAQADVILFVGSDFPFARTFFPKDAKMIQVDVDSAKIGRRHFTDIPILADAGETLRLLAKTSSPRKNPEWIEPNRENMRNWKQYLAKFADRDDVPLRCEPVFKEINRIATDDAVFITDVGNTTIHAIRLLDMNGKDQRFVTSGLFATMGIGVPGGIAAKLQYPERQVFTLNGDGAFAMVMHDVSTQVKYKLPVINVVFSNDSFGFIEAEQEDTGQSLYGVDLDPIDFAKAAVAMGAKGFTVRKRDELASVFDAARDAETPVVIDVKVKNYRPFPAEFMTLKPEIYENEDFKKRYEVGDMPTLVDLLNS